jgi:hypothetical protein
MRWYKIERSTGGVPNTCSLAWHGEPRSYSKAERHEVLFWYNGSDTFKCSEGRADISHSRQYGAKEHLLAELLAAQIE